MNTPARNRLPFCYSNPHPAVSTDIVLFTVRDNRLEVLLQQRSNEPFKGRWALPGGFVDIGDDLDRAASMHLRQHTGIGDVYLEQLFTFGALNRDPRERVITVAYFALVPNTTAPSLDLDAAQPLQWLPVQKLPALAFDHGHIVETARKRLTAKARYSTIACQLLPPEFTLSELQHVYEILLNEPLDKRNFRKWISSLDFVVATEKMRRNGQHRPARLFRAIEPRRVVFIR